MITLPAHHFQTAVLWFKSYSSDVYLASTTTHLEGAGGNGCASPNFPSRYVLDLNNLSITILIILFYLQECFLTCLGGFPHLDMSISNVVGWGDPPCHTAFAFFDVWGGETLSVTPRSLFLTFRDGETLLVTLRSHFSTFWDGETFLVTSRSHFSTFRNEETLLVMSVFEPPHLPPILLLCSSAPSRVFTRWQGFSTPTTIPSHFDHHHTSPLFRRLSSPCLSLAFDAMAKFFGPHHSSVHPG